MQEYMVVSLEWNGHFGIATKNHRGQWHIANASFATQSEAQAHIDHQRAYEAKLWGLGKHPAQLAATRQPSGPLTADELADAELAELTGAMAKGALRAARNWAHGALGLSARGGALLSAADDDDAENLGYVCDELRDYARGLLEYADQLAAHEASSTR